MIAPNNLSNLQCWYKADSIFNLSNGDPVTNNSVYWPDSGPNAYHITTFVGTSPTWSATGAPNSRPAVHFAGNGLLQLPSAALGMFNNKAGGTSFAVISSSLVGTQYMFRASIGTNNQYARYAHNHNIRADLEVGGRRLDTDNYVTTSGTTVMTTNTFYIESMYQDWVGNKQGLRLNGGSWTTFSPSWTSGSTGNSDVTNSICIDLGGNANGGSGPVYSSCYIAEVFVFDRILTASEHAQMDTYLSTKYGITVGDMLTFVSPAMGYVKQRGFL